MSRKQWVSEDGMKVYEDERESLEDLGMDAHDAIEDVIEGLKYLESLSKQMHLPIFEKILGKEIKTLKLVKWNL